MKNRKFTIKLRQGESRISNLKILEFEAKDFPTAHQEAVRIAGNDFKFSIFEEGETVTPRKYNAFAI